MQGTPRSVRSRLAVAGTCALLVVLVGLIVLTIRRDGGELARETPEQEMVVALRDEDGVDVGQVRLEPSGSSTLVDLLSNPAGEYQVKLGSGTCAAPTADADSIMSSLDGGTRSDGTLQVDQPLRDLRGRTLTLLRQEGEVAGFYQPVGCGSISN